MCQIKLDLLWKRGRDVWVTGWYLPANWSVGREVGGVGLTCGPVEVYEHKSTCVRMCSSRSPGTWGTQNARFVLRGSVQ